MERIKPSDLIPMDVFAGDEPIRVDLVYADARHPRNIFKQALYAPRARLWLHRDLARIVLIASRIVNGRFGGALELKDGLRTVDAQEAMQDTDIVRAHPEWCEGETRMLSPPGQGAHPRGMAIDVCLLKEDGTLADMGTPFDDMSPLSARSADSFPPAILQNRKELEGAFVDAAARLNLPLLPLPNEWWDFRFPRSVYETYAPLRDSDLPGGMRMTAAPGAAPAHIEHLKAEILDSLSRIL